MEHAKMGEVMSKPLLAADLNEDLTEAVAMLREVERMVRAYYTLYPHGSKEEFDRDRSTVDRLAAVLAKHQGK